MIFSANKMPVEVIKEGTFGGTKSWKELDQLKNIDKKYYCSNYYDVIVNKYNVKRGTSLIFWENNCWINEIDLYGWFQWYFRYWLGRRSEDDERQINRWKKNCE